ncbi:MAG: fumarylacetoacetate hydrolase family protein [Pigmentiphaga sp.]
MFQLVSFDYGQGPVVGLREGENYFDSATFSSMREILDAWDLAIEKLGTASERMSWRTPHTAVRLLAPLAEPRNIYFTGANYIDHLEEMSRTMGMPMPDLNEATTRSPWFLLKSTAAVVGPGAVVSVPPGVEHLDWEIELAVLIGRKTHNVSVKNALNSVAGYMIANDLSARDRMKRVYESDGSPFQFDWVGHKSFDGACPMGPAITPASQVKNVQSLSMKLWVNGELMQDSNTSRMIYSVAEQISHLSKNLTLYPGDVILTGTPAGVGAARNRFLNPGDVIRQEIESIGAFEFSIG